MQLRYVYKIEIYDSPHVATIVPKTVAIRDVRRLMTNRYVHVQSYCVQQTIPVHA